MEDNYYTFLEKYAENRHTQDEHQAFLTWFNSISPIESRKVMDRYQLFLKNNTEPVTSDNHDELIGKIEARIDQIEQGEILDNEDEIRIVGLWSYARRFAAAAAVFVLIGVGSYYVVLHRSGSKTKIANQVVSTDAVPGGNKAMLMLADGSVINLNEAVDGQIASQSGIKISKVTDGQLVYGQQIKGEDQVSNKSGTYNQITTPKAGQYQISLSDGTKVWLNSLSSIRFPAVFSGEERKVEITGEVYFEVASMSLNNKRVPFRVVSNNQIIEVIGTHFNVNSYRDEFAVKTTLLEGSVKVSTIANGKVSPETVKLKPGEQSIVMPKQATIAIEKVDTESAVAWQKGYFKFKDTSIQEVMRQLSRWYDLDVVYSGPLPQDQFTGYVSKKVAISSVLNILEEGGGVKFTIKNKKVEVTALE